MMLRIQKERIVGKIMPSQKIYFKKYGLDYNKLKYAKKNAFVMHPGPMNIDAEITREVANSENSLVLKQVENGLYLRTALLSLIL